MVGADSPFCYVYIFCKRVQSIVPAKIQTQDCRKRSTNVTSVPCLWILFLFAWHPLMLKEKIQNVSFYISWFLRMLRPITFQVIRRLSITNWKINVAFTLSLYRTIMQWIPLSLSILCCNTHTHTHTHMLTHACRVLSVFLLSDLSFLRDKIK